MQRKGAKAQGRWCRRANAGEVSQVIETLAARQSDRRLAIWLRVRLGGKPMTTVAADYGYRDGSGVHRVVERLEAKAKSDRALDRQLRRFVREVSSVRS